MSNKDIREILGLNENESIVKDDVNVKELTKRLNKVKEYKRLAKNKKDVNWEKLKSFRFKHFL